MEVDDAGSLSPLDRVNKMLTADFPGRQGPCSSFVAAIDVFGQLSVAMRHAGLVVTTAWQCGRVQAS